MLALEFNMSLSARSSSSLAAATSYLSETCHQRGPMPCSDQRAPPTLHCLRLILLQYFGAGSATPDTVVDNANPESAVYTPLPAPAPVAVFGAGSATPDTAVDHVNFDDADLGEIESEGEDEQPSTAYLAENDVVPGGSNDCKLDATQFAAMKELKDNPREHMRYRETRNAPNLATLALVETLLMDLAEKPTDSLFQYRSCARSVSQALPATGFVKPDAAFETGKAWITRQWEESRQVIQHIRLSMAGPYYPSRSQEN